MKKAKLQKYFLEIRGKLITAVFMLPVLLLILNSCIGLSLDIKMNRDGSGVLNFEYRISRSIESLGSLDGNISKPPIPVTHEDWKRSIDRVDGAKLVSFSQKQSRQDTVYTVSINFNNPQTMLAIIDPAGKKSQIINDGTQNKIVLLINEEALSSSNEYDKNLMDLAQVLFKDYNFSISFAAQGNSNLNITTGEGNETNFPLNAQVVSSGRQVSMTIGMMDLIELPEGLGVEINW